MVRRPPRPPRTDSRFPYTPLCLSGFGEGGASLDQETMEKLFGCAGRVDGGDTIPEAARQRLAAEADRHAKATVSRSLEQNSAHFNQARDKLEKWADDMVLSAEKAQIGRASCRERVCPYV